MTNLRKRIGQSTIESAVLGTLILGAISYMVTYVVGSWNAHVKNYEETVRESETEQYTGGPVPPFNRGPCRIGNLIPSNPPICGTGGLPCGTTPNCTENCPVGTRLAQRSCINCAASECRPTECLPYGGCCTQWRPNCALPGNISCCGVNANCPDGQAWSWRICGGNAEWACIDNAYCEFNCTGNRPQYTEVCPNDEVRLPGPVPWVMAGPTSASCTTTTKCELYCGPLCCAEGFAPCVQNECYE